ncbi:MAG: hypothetical protein Q9164_000799 [Protoblastenia rupestris]
MQHSQSTTDTPEHDSTQLAPLDLSVLPTVYLLTSHLSSEEQHEAEDLLSSGGAPLTYDIKEANLILGNISRARRAKLELQWKGVHVVEDEEQERFGGDRSTPARKKRKIEGLRSKPDKAAIVVASSSETGSETGDDAPASQSFSQLSISQTSESHASGKQSPEKSGPFMPFTAKFFKDVLLVLRLEWLHQSVAAGEFLSLNPYILYEARLDGQMASAAKDDPIMKLPESAPVTPNVKDMRANQGNSKGIIERAKTDEKPVKKAFRKRDRIKEAADKDFVGRSFSSSTQATKALLSKSFHSRPTHLLHQTTSEHDEDGVSVFLPPMPDWVVQNKIYSCERATPLDSPNKDFIAQLKQIKLARLLTLDEIGVRAYSTSIASLAAYPYRLQSTEEILALPGCDQKIAHLFHEYKTNDGHIKAVTDLEADPALSVLREFYEIWGVGGVTAREFYYDKGWRDLDDITEFGWKTLSRVQQIGLKYYDEFQLKIPRAEVESIAATISKHAKRVTDPNIETIIVGGYRRGKPESGDVDVILSHRNQALTLDLVSQVVKSLEKEGWITHCLTLNLTNTKRNQEPLPVRTGTLGGHGFDTLDKALVVWQDANWPTKTADLAANPKTKNPNPHRRVDIIISPWRTVGCAVSGWTSGTTFQRDLRRYAKKVKGWKFDSSGVRERATGAWVDLEGWRDEKTRCEGWEEAERRVFEGMGLVYREPWDRCTG